MLNRLELSPLTASAGSRSTQSVADTAAMDALLVDLFLESHDSPPAESILDVDAPDDPVQGTQEGRFFHGYYGQYCSMPLYILCGEQVLCARLRTADQDGAEGTVEELERSVGRVRARWPGVLILLRGDSGFCREQMMDWCETHHGGFLLGLANNARLKDASADELQEAKAEYKKTGEAARVCGDVRDRTLESWSRERRVVGTAEHLPKGDTPRCVVTTLSPAEYDARTLYEQMECARGDRQGRGASGPCSSGQ